MITRFRIEAKGATEEAVKDELIEQAVHLRANKGWNWEEEDDGIQMMATKNGFWGRLTIRRVDSDVAAGAGS